VLLGNGISNWDRLRFPARLAGFFFDDSTPLPAEIFRQLKLGFGRPGQHHCQDEKNNHEARNHSLFGDACKFHSVLRQWTFPLEARF